MNSPHDAFVSRAEFEEFLRVFTHEIRNRLNSISLEATDLAEQAGNAADAMRLQQSVRDCAALMKTARELLTPDDPETKKLTVAEAIAKLQRRSR